MAKPSFKERICPSKNDLAILTPVNHEADGVGLWQTGLSLKEPESVLHLSRTSGPRLALSRRN